MAYREYILEGNPGAGKTSVLSKLQPALEQRSLIVHLVAPFRVVKDELRKDHAGEDPLYDIWQSQNLEEALMALKKLRKVVEGARIRMNEMTKSQDGVLLFDRGWLTLLRALEDMGVSSTEIEKEKTFWLNLSEPDSFFLTTRPTISKQANKQRDLKANWRLAARVLEEDYQRRRTLIEAHRDRVINIFEITDLDQDRWPIARAIEAYVVERG